MKSVIIIPDRCIGCKQCEIACSVEHSKSKNIYSSVFETPKSAPRIFVLPGDHSCFSFPNKCRHCDPAPCLMICPTGAIFEDSSLILVDPTKCIGCRMCAMVCPFYVIRYRESPDIVERHVATKCDGCIDRVKKGNIPACVETCKTGAILFDDLNKILKDKGLNFAKKVFLVQKEGKKIDVLQEKNCYSGLQELKENLYKTKVVEDE